MRNYPAIPVLGICAYGSGAGKTTLLTTLIPLLKEMGVRVSVIKHAHHKFDIDHPGKDSYKIREAGAVQTLVSSNKRWALMTELPASNDNNQLPELEALLSQLDPKVADLVMVEGYREANIPKIEVFRNGLNYPLLASQGTLAIASDTKVDSELPILDINQPSLIARFIMEWLEDEATR